MRITNKFEDKEVHSRLSTNSIGSTKDSRKLNVFEGNKSSGFLDTIKTIESIGSRNKGNLRDTRNSRSLNELRISKRNSIETQRNIRDNKGARSYSIKGFIFKNIQNNLKEYIIVTLIFLIGIIAGVIFINHVNETQINEIQEYINNFINSLKGDYSIDKMDLLKNSLVDDIKLAIGMWFIGSTVIGMPIVLGIILFRGFCIGYTVSASIAILGMQKGIIFFLTTIFLQSIIFIPAIIAFAVSGMKLYKSIMKDKRKENIKLEIIRHTMSCLLLLVILIIASLVEVYISTNLFTTCIGWF